MTNETATRDQLIASHTQMAERIAIRFSASHPEIDRADLKQMAVVSMINAIDSYTHSEAVPLVAHVSRNVTSDLVDVFDKERRRSILFPTIPLAIIGTEDGDPLNSLRDLRNPSSLNPSPDIYPSLREDIGEIRAMATIQCCESDHRHGILMRGAKMSRELVRQVRERVALRRELRIARAVA